MPTALLTGSAGFFGSVLKRRLLNEGWTCVGIDLHEDPFVHERWTTVRGDIRQREIVETIFKVTHIDCIFHCAAILAHDVSDQDFLWTSNVDGTEIIASTASQHGVKHLVFISSNCLWGSPVGHPIGEDEPPCPSEIYGRSKLAAEEMLQKYAGAMNIVTLRSTTIIDAGRLGLLAILFRFIDEGRRAWVVGKGDNRYQFIAAQDLATACILAAAHDHSDTFNVGSDNVRSLADTYRTVIATAGTRARVASLPRAPTLAAMRLCHFLGISPLGPYHYKMIAEDFSFDTSRIKQVLGWKPSAANEDVLTRAYQYYHEHKDDIAERTGDVSAHSRPARMGIINLLRLLS